MKIDDLDEFCRALPGKPTRAGVIRQAIRELIARHLADDAALRSRFWDIKHGEAKAATRGLRIVK